MLHHPILELTSPIENALINDLALFESEYSVYIPYFNYRTQTDQEQLKDSEWE